MSKSKPSGVEYTKSKVENLYKRANGIYYSRVWIGRRRSWKSLKTDTFSIAKARHSEVMRQQNSRKPIKDQTFKTMAPAIGRARDEVQASVKTRELTKAYWLSCARMIESSWPQLAATEPRHVTIQECESWASRFSKRYSAMRYNNSLSLLQRIFEIALEAGAIAESPAKALKRAPVRTKRPFIPTKEQKDAIIESILGQRKHHSKITARLVEFISCSGARINEARHVQRKHIYFESNEIEFVETKNGKSRRVPINSSLAALLKKMHVIRFGSERFLFEISSAKTALNNVSKRLGLPSITHHTFRHYFATQCLQSGVDVRTLAEWLGHQDNGVTLLKTYAHVLNDHSQAAARKVDL